MTVIALLRLDRQRFSLLGGGGVLYWAECEVVVKGNECYLSHTTLTVFELLSSACFLPGGVLSMQFSFSLWQGRWLHLLH